MKKPLIFGSLIFSSLISNAEPTSGPITIGQLRPYNTEGENSTNHFYLYTDDKPFCDASMYQIRGDYKGSEHVYATALAAHMGGKKVRIEMTKDGCNNGRAWPTIQSIYIHR